MARVGRKPRAACAGAAALAPSCLSGAPRPRTRASRHQKVVWSTGCAPGQLPSHVAALVRGPSAAHHGSCDLPE